MIHILILDLFACFEAAEDIVNCPCELARTVLSQIQTSEGANTTCTNRSELLRVRVWGPKSDVSPPER